MFETLYCYERPDLYAIITSILFLNLGILGLTTNNSYLNDVNACLMLTGICSILEFSGVINDIYHIPLTAQLILLIRGSNLKRKVAIRGTPFINVAYYVGRFNKDS